VSDDRASEEAYRAEMRGLVAQRFRTAVLLFAAFVAAAEVLEWDSLLSADRNRDAEGSCSALLP
jgi:hypothetical protein